MELGVRDWMIIVGVLLILAVLLDGFRRIRNERRGKIRLALNKQFVNSEDVGEEDLPNSELPNGGARIVPRSTTRSTVPQSTTASRSKTAPHSKTHREEPRLGEIDELDLDQSVPLLMESVASANRAGTLAPKDEVEEYEPEAYEPKSGDLFAQQPEPSARQPAPQRSMSRVSEPPPVPASTSTSAPAPISAPKAATPKVPEEEAPSQAEPERRRESAPAHAGQQEIIIINAVSREQPFQGADLLHILLACDLRYGKMNIFHRHEQANGRGQVQFSVANSVEPGTFNLDAINGFTTPGVCFFMSVPGPEEPLKAFECMVETAQCVVRNLGGELHDESRSAMTAQTLEHCRQRLREFERRQLAQV